MGETENSPPIFPRPPVPFRRLGLPPRGASFDILYEIDGERLPPLVEMVVLRACHGHQLYEADADYRRDIQCHHNMVQYLHLDLFTIIVVIYPSFSKSVNLTEDISNEINFKFGKLFYCLNCSLPS